MKSKAYIAMTILASTPAFSQSNAALSGVVDGPGSYVTLSGVMDAGVTYISNEGGHHNIVFDDGIAVPNLLVLSGREDLGGGTAAIFQLADQFTIGTGSFTGDQSLFSRQAKVGLASAEFGTLTFGNQYDFMSDSLVGGFNDGAILTSGLYSFRNGPFDKLALPNNPTGAFEWDRLAGQSLPSSVKYVTRSYDGLSAGAMYSFGGVAGSVGTDNGSSFGLNYANGPFGMNAAYVNLKSEVSGAQASVRNWGVGTHYLFGRWIATALFTTVHNGANDGSVWEGEVGLLYQFTPECALSGLYTYMKGNAVVDNNHAHQMTGTLSYALSKRTSVYVDGVYQRTNRGAAAQINGVLATDGASSGVSQFISRVGVQTRF
jgi:predicted porin